MDVNFKSKLISFLLKGQAQNLGFKSSGEAVYRADATAWSIMALQAAGLPLADLSAARAGLAAAEQPDGRVSIIPEHPEAFWTTALAILAWQGDPNFREAQVRAVQFLLQTKGQVFAKTKDSPIGHDTSIHGWPWIVGTHPWVMPTALAMLALRVSGYGRHERVQEARRLLLDRQLGDGGWNYGNTTVFGQKLNPMPESTGAALSALAGLVTINEIAGSLSYLKARVTQLRTPLALSWSLLGLSAWNDRPPEAEEMIQECWQRQERYGEYNTCNVALLLLALTAPAGIVASLNTEAD